VGLSTRIEIARKILVNAVNMNMSKNILLKISQKMDKYIVQYYIEKKEEEDAEK